MISVFEINGGTDMIGLAVACTILGGIVGASLEPVSFSVSIPIAIMGGFIMKEIRDKKDEKYSRIHRKTSF